MIATNIGDRLKQAAAMVGEPNLRLIFAK